ncbi:MAG: chemotaxis protein CheW [Desulfomonilaceae bacterium]
MNIPGTNTESSKINQSADKARILRDRALTLAKRPVDTIPEFQTIEVLVFALGEERYAVGSETVREVCPLKQITRVPCVPPFVLGIMNLRGKIFSVIDLKRLFGLPQGKTSDQSKVIIIGFNDMDVGIQVDDVTGVKQIPVSEIQQDLPTLSGIQEKYLYGITPERLTIINVETLLTDESIVIQETVGP